MIPNDTPWSGLEPGKTDTRRVDASAKWNWFWAVMPRTDAALVLQLSQLPNPLPDLPNLKNLEIRFQTLPGGPILYIRLKENSQLELFEALCRDVMAACEHAECEREALERAIGRTFRWHNLLRGGKLGVLSEEEQKGLIGEIEVLKLLIGEIGPKATLEGWTGPSGAPKDFELHGDCIEVKARRGASQPFVSISSEHQLSDVPSRRLWLAVISVDRTQPPHGRSLNEFVSEVSELLQEQDPGAMGYWETRLAEAGFDGADDYSAWRWLISTPEFHAVSADFPRIVSPLPTGVTNVSYAISLSECARHRSEWGVVRSLIKEVQS